MEQTVGRKDLLSVLLNQSISNVEVKEITIPAGGKAAYHLHPCPVVGYVSSGTVLFQIEGEPKEIFQEGCAFYEPKDKPIVHFDNASKTEPLTFIAFYLREEEEDFITIL